MLVKNTLPAKNAVNDLYDIIQLHIDTQSV